MPIYDQSYRHWDGILNEKTNAWLVIARNGIRMLWQRWIILLIIFASIPFLVRVAQIYLISGFGFSVNELGEFGKNFQIDTAFFEKFIYDQSFFIVLMILLVGSGLIANDKKFNAIQIYFSKPLTKIDYLMGKYAIVGFYVGLISFLPAFVLFLTKVLLSDDFSFLKQHFWIPLSLFGYYILIVLVLGGLILAFSSFSKSSRFTGIGFFAFLTITDIIKSIFSSIPEVGAVSIVANIRQVADILFSQTPTFNYPVWLAIIMNLFVIAVSFLILRIQIRGTDIVK